MALGKGSYACLGEEATLLERVDCVLMNERLRSSRSRKAGREEGPSCTGFNRTRPR